MIFHTLGEEKYKFGHAFDFGNSVSPICSAGNTYGKQNRRTHVPASPCLSSISYHTFQRLSIGGRHFPFFCRETFLHEKYRFRTVSLVYHHCFLPFLPCFRIFRSFVPGERPIRKGENGDLPYAPHFFGQFYARYLYFLPFS